MSSENTGKAARKEKAGKRFRMSLVDDLTHDQIRTIRYTKAGMVLTIVTIFLVLSVLIFALIAYTPLHNSIPGYPDSTTKAEAVQNAIRIDSLENLINRWELYSTNLANVLEGLPAVPTDTAGTPDGSVSAKEAARLARQDSLLRQTIREKDKLLQGGQTHDQPLEGLHFFSPMKGTLAEGFEKASHPYVEISAADGTAVMAVLDGTVVHAGWEENEGGYTIVIQHADNIVSIYRQNQKALKSAGDKVSAGTPIALVGKGGEKQETVNLVFELWHSGEAADPATYINF